MTPSCGTCSVTAHRAARCSMVPGGAELASLQAPRDRVWCSTASLLTAPAPDALSRRLPDSRPPDLASPSVHSPLVAAVGAFFLGRPVVPVGAMPVLGCGSPAVRRTHQIWRRAADYTRSDDGGEVGVVKQIRRPAEIRLHSGATGADRAHEDRKESGIV